MARNSPPKLVDMPELAMNRIMEEFDYKSIQPLRKVCHSIRDFIDDQSPNTNIENILIECDQNTGDYRILYDNDGPDVNTGTMKSVYYEKYGNGCLIRYEDKEIVLENEDFLNRSMEDLKIIIGSKNMVVRYLRLDQNPLNCGTVDARRIPKGDEKVDFSHMLDALKEKVLEPLTPKLKVHRLMIETNDQTETMKVLPHVNLEFLKELCIFKSVKDGNKVLEMNEILELNQLKNLEKLEVIKCIIPDHLATHFVHIPYCDIHVETIRSNDLLVLKERLLHSPRFQKYSIEFLNFPDGEQFVRENGTWDTLAEIVGLFRKRSYFQMEDADSILMITYQTLIEKKVVFEKTTLRQIENSRTPEDRIVIQ